MQQNTRPVVIAGAGPVGMIAAADLVRRGIPVLVLEKNEKLSSESRASTFHPPTLDMLDDLGFAKTLISQGLKAPKVQYASTIDGELGVFDFAAISDLTRHPYRLQAEQFKLTRIILDALEDNPLFEIRFGCEVIGVDQDASGVNAVLQGGSEDRLRCEWLIGADGANSAVRRCQNIAFDGFTWPERFLVITTSADVAAAKPGVTSVSYWADPERWHFFLRIIDAWRIMVPVAAEVTDDDARTMEYARDALLSTLPKQIGAAAPIEHTTLYRVHQRVASNFRAGRTFLAGDAAHINNPLGGMGMNGGLHDALNLADRLAAVIEGREEESFLDAYDRQRRAVTMDAIQVGTIRNKRNLEAKTPEDQESFRSEIRDAMADVDKTRAFLRRISMIESLEKAAQL
ncbi:FAD-dependent oxidoreductase [Ottowia thiooxydans]|uniref:FAD-dependent oxidoreductase n=1 Tax=Ottowia thiooxydans TaxID=219182 RepID=UPI00040F485C|nr:FAD-dependent monooxygenase [Ottowia thiooxydans]